MRVLFTEKEKAAMMRLANDLDFPLDKLVKIKPEQGYAMEIELKPDQVVKNLNDTVSLLSKFSKSVKKDKGTKVLLKMSKMFPKGFIR